MYLSRVSRSLSRQLVQASREFRAMRYWVCVSTILVAELTLELAVAFRFDVDSATVTPRRPALKLPPENKQMLCLRERAFSLHKEAPDSIRKLAKLVQWLTGGGVGRKEHGCLLQLGEHAPNQVMFRAASRIYGHFISHSVGLAQRLNALLIATSFIVFLRQSKQNSLPARLCTR